MLKCLSVPRMAHFNNAHEASLSGSARDWHLSPSAFLSVLKISGCLREHTHTILITLEVALLSNYP